MALLFGPPAFLGGGQEPSAGQPTPPEEPSPPPETTTEQDKNEDGTPKTVIIRVTGTPGVAFVGSYAAGGDSHRGLKGVTPRGFEVEVRTGADGVAAADSVAANVRKPNEGDEELTLQLLVDGEVVEEKSTAEQFGWVSV